MAALLFAACAHESTPMTPVAPPPRPPTPPPAIVAPPLGVNSPKGFDDAVARFGTREFSAPYDAVVEATLGALRSQGYAIAAHNPRTGVIRTERRVISRYEQAQFQNNGLGSPPSAVGYTVVVSRQYSVTVRRRDAVHTVVELRPRMFTGEAEVAPVMIDGPGGERDSWQHLFHEIEELL